MAARPGEEVQIGVGSFSTVTKITTRGGPGGGTTAAIKTIENALSPERDNAEIVRLLRELIILREFSHPNILSASSITRDGPASTSHDTSQYHVRITTPHMDCDLSAMLRTPRVAQSLTPKQITFIYYQVLAGLNYLHEHEVIHRDLNPRNIFVSSTGMVKIGDFGLCSLSAAKKRKQQKKTTRKQQDDEGESKRQTKREENIYDDGECDEDSLLWRTLRVSNVHCTPYTSPEIVLERKKCTPSSDMWAAGIVLVEMLVSSVEDGMSILLPSLRGGGRGRGHGGSSSSSSSTAVDPATVIVDLVAMLGGGEDDWKTYSKKNKQLFDQERTKNRGNVPSLSLREWSSVAHPLVSLAKTMLQYRPERRATAREAMFDSAAFENLGETWSITWCGLPLSTTKRIELFCFEIEKRKGIDVNRERLMFEVGKYMDGSWRRR